MRYRIIVQTIKTTPALIYHAHDYNALLAVHAAGVNRIVYDSHELFFDRTKESDRTPAITAYQSIERLAERDIARTADAVVVTSPEHGRVLQETLDIPVPVLVRNTVDLRQQTKKEVDFLQSGYRIVAHSGGICTGRHLEEVVDALPYLPDDILLLLLGDGPLRIPLLKRAQTMGVVERLVIIPPVTPNAVVSTLNQADAAIVMIELERPSYRYSLPNKFFEAVAANLPLVISPIPAVLELTEHYDIGVVCERPDDPESVARSIEQILNPDENQRLRVNVQKARNELNWESESRRLTSLYNELLKA